VGTAGLLLLLLLLLPSADRGPCLPAQQAMMRTYLVASVLA
jgi:hypothetical protein